MERDWRTQHSQLSQRQLLASLRLLLLMAFHQVFGGITCFATLPDTRWHPLHWMTVLPSPGSSPLFILRVPNRTTDLWMLIRCRSSMACVSTFSG